METGTSLHVEQRAITSLVAYERNARTHTDEQVAQVAASIRAFGWTNPILVDELGGIIAGHARFAAAKSLGMDAVPVIALPGLSDTERRALVLADNQIALNAGWDFGVLQGELTALRAEDFEVGILGFDEVDLQKIDTWPNMPSADPMREPERKSEVVVLIRCTRAAFESAMQDTITKWATLENVGIDIS